MRITFTKNYTNFPRSLTHLLPLTPHSLTHSSLSPLLFTIVALTQPPTTHTLLPLTHSPHFLPFTPHSSYATDMSILYRVFTPVPHDLLVLIALFGAIFSTNVLLVVCLNSQIDYCRN